MSIWANLSSILEGETSIEIMSTQTSLDDEREKLDASVQPFKFAQHPAVL